MRRDYSHPYPRSQEAPSSPQLLHLSSEQTLGLGIPPASFQAGGLGEGSQASSSYCSLASPSPSQDQPGSCLLPPTHCVQGLPE